VALCGTVWHCVDVHGCAWYAYANNFLILPSSFSSSFFLLRQDERYRRQMYSFTRTKYGEGSSTLYLGIAQVLLAVSGRYLQHYYSTPASTAPPRITAALQFCPLSCVHSRPSSNHLLLQISPL
jgi:hypothetical protein